jgi:hypothetical protein
MNTTHDPTRHVSYLQQCLSQDKRSIGFFIGAGCPLSITVTTASGKEPLIPDVQGLTSLVATELRKTALAAAFQKIEDHLKADGHTAV